MSHTLLIINPGSTSTKVAIYEDQVPVVSSQIDHDPEEIKSFASVSDQFDYRARDMRGGWPRPCLAALARGLKLSTPIPTRVLCLPLPTLWVATAVVLGNIQKHAGKPGNLPGQKQER